MKKAEFLFFTLLFSFFVSSSCEVNETRRFHFYLKSSSFRALSTGLGFSLDSYSRLYKKLLINEFCLFLYKKIYFNECLSILIIIMFEIL